MASLAARLLDRRTAGSPDCGSGKDRRHQALGQFRTGRLKNFPDRLQAATYPIGLLASFWGGSAQCHPSSLQISAALSCDSYEFATVRTILSELAVFDTRNERAIDLDVVEEECLKIHEGRITHPEIMRTPSPLS